jgi:hypothetical protein
VGGEDADGRRRVLRHQRVDLGVGSPWVVVEQRELPGVGAVRQRDRVLDGGVAEKAQPLQFGRGVLRIVHQQVGALEFIVPGLNGVEGPAIAQLLGPDREMRRP